MSPPMYMKLHISWEFYLEKNPPRWKVELVFLDCSDASELICQIEYHLVEL